MTPDLLAELAARWNRRWLGGALAASAAAGGMAAVAAARRCDVPSGWAAAIGASAALLALGAALLRRPRVDARTVARHLDRTLPALEESAELALAGESGLSPLERLQRRRVLDRLAASAEPALPHRPLRRMLRLATVLFAAAATMALWPAGAIPRAPSDVAGAPPPPAAPALGEVEIIVAPPAYTGRRARRSREPDVEGIEAGARVTWRVAVHGSVNQAALVTTVGDSVPLRPDGPRHFAGTLTPEGSLLYQVVARGPGGRGSTAYHRLVVVPDAAPVVTVVRPDLRTTFPPADTARVTLEVLASDDHGLAGADIVATLTSGQGEAVRFREQRIPFDRREERQGGGWLLRATLDLVALGLGPGDELYFHASARDRRSPEPNEGRSETHFVAIRDTARVVLSDFSGLALDVSPEYFRSQRQIIIDTERLLAERSRITEREFRDRSQDIGLDQHLLRLRYGEMVGDEEEPGDVTGVDETGRPDVHQHDTEENATLLARTVKQTLKAALAEMWDAELRLRTYQPGDALPFEYRALELLKQVQRAARIYVRRSGFEPAPLEPDRNRLTGELAGIASRSRAAGRRAADTLPAVRAALAALDGERVPAAGRIAALEDAGRELARLATDDPAGHLGTLAVLRDLIASLEADGEPCAPCAERVRRGLWKALPAPPSPPAPARTGVTGLTRAYREQLERVQ